LSQPFSRLDAATPALPRFRRRFRRIFALGERGATTAEGSGIGLALARLMVERSGGRIELADSDFGGARFLVTVPQV
jgi:signal transduction histidine kinase